MRNFFYLALTLLAIWYFAHRDHFDIGQNWPAIKAVAAEQVTAPLSAPAPGELAPNEPVQVMLSPGKVNEWSYNGCNFTPLATYDITARVISRCIYTSDQFAVVSPLDLVLGWGRMSDPTIYGKLKIDQSSRAETVALSDSTSFPLTEDEVISHSANNHLIPADGTISNEILGFQAGDVIRLTGYLVEIDKPGSWHTASSLSRTDTGDTGCEIIWVTSAVKVGR